MVIKTRKKIGRFVELLEKRALAEGEVDSTNSLIMVALSIALVYQLSNGIELYLRQGISLGALFVAVCAGGFSLLCWLHYRLNRAERKELDSLQLELGEMR